MDFERFIAIAVAQALDDQRLTVEQTLVLIARSAYAAGRQQNYEHGVPDAESQSDSSPDPPVSRRRTEFAGLLAARVTR